jgi:poly(A) polymerase
LDAHQFCLDQLARLREQDLRPAPLLTGVDLLGLGYPAGPLFGSILEALEEAQLDGALHTREEAIAFVTRRWPITGGSALA